MAVFLKDYMNVKLRLIFKAAYKSAPALIINISLIYWVKN